MIDLKHYLDRYAKEDFISEYKKYLGNPNGECPYADIDAAGTEDEIFYKDLRKFLTKCLGDLGYEFESPVKSKYPFAIKFRDMDNKDIYLRSDLFGFSALYIKSRKNNICKKSGTWNGKRNYPYARYLSVNCDDDKGAVDPEKGEFVASCIYETRTIGGSFIWPVVKRKRKKRNKDEYEDYFCSTYNRQRGENNYIEDRVDITLYEICCFYDVYFPLKKKNYKSFEEGYIDFKEKYKEKYPKNILFNSQGEDEKEAIYRWLSIFETFEGYVTRLKFKDFVIQKEDKFLIRDMANEDALSVLDIDKVKENEIKKIQDMNPSEIKILLKNVKECTELRSKAIEDLLLK